MKVTLLKEDKKLITLADAPIVRQIITDMKEDASTAEEYAEMAVRAAYNYDAYSIEVFKASAKIATNYRAFNVFTENSGNLDIWINATACVNDEEFIMIGVYLSDIWQLTGRKNENQGIVSNMYIRRFKEVK